MPNMINIKASVEFSPDNRPTIYTGELQFSYEGDSKRYVRGIQEIGDTEEAIAVGDISEIGFVVIVNRSKTIDVQIGLTGSYTVDLKPGQMCAFTPAGTLYAVAASDTADIEYFVFPAEVTES